MAANSAIEWTHHTFNPWRGCTKVSTGCANCYAEKLSGRNHAVLGTWGDNGTRVIAPKSYWRYPVRWNKAAAAAGQRHRVFCASLADVFEDRPELNEPRAHLFDLIHQTPHLDWLLLTKRPENVLPILRDGVRREFPEEWLLEQGNVWLGVTVENQEQADKRIPILLQIPATVRFLSCEPLLGSVDLSETLDVCQRNGLWMPRAPHCPYGLHWVIAGGESGPHARPMHRNWLRSLRNQCQAAGVPFFFKQWGEWVPPELNQKSGLWHTCFSDGSSMVRVGKKAAGRLLDGRTWDEFPEVQR